jgi:DNA-binding LytR/AlgR family response regulator
MNVVIVEDEPLAACNLEKLLLSLAPDFHLVKKLSSVNESISWFNANPSPDLLFMDIQLSDGISFEIFKRSPLECPIIFTTAYNDYALRAFKVNSIDYLLKPIDKNELKVSIEKFRRWKHGNLNVDFHGQLHQLIQDMNGNKEAKKYKERFLVLHKHSIMPIVQSQVNYLYKEELIYLRTVDNQKFPTDYHTMDELEEIVDPNVFFRANRQFLIHIQSVESYQSGLNGKLSVKLKAPVFAEIEISREKAGAFKDWLN